MFKLERTHRTQKRMKYVHDSVSSNKVSLTSKTKVKRIVNVQMCIKYFSTDIKFRLSLSNITCTIMRTNFVTSGIKI